MMDQNQAISRPAVLKTCSKCKQTKNYGDFGQKSRGSLRSWCISCDNAFNQERRLSLETKKLCNICGKKEATSFKRCSNCLEHRNSLEKARRTKFLEAALALYGGHCVCCGTNQKEFLTFDHVNNDGSIARQQPGYKGGSFYKTLIKLGYRRSDIQLLCYNCNCGRYRNKGIYPHKATSC